MVIARRGTPVDLHVTNHLVSHRLAFAIDDRLTADMVEDGLLDPATDNAHSPCLAVHLHGGITSPTPDGEPLDTFLPCQSVTYLYGNTQEAADLWYHCHARDHPAQRLRGPCQRLPHPRRRPR